MYKTYHNSIHSVALSDALKAAVCVSLSLSPGHSRSVVGLEQKRNGSLCLLLFDPGCSPSEMARLLEQDTAVVTIAIRRMRKFPNHLKHQQYQVLVVEGLLTPEQKQVRINTHAHTHTHTRAE